MSEINEKMVRDNEKKVNFEISGMHCASCVNTIEKSLKNLVGVNDIRVNLGTESVQLEYNPEKLPF
ncbi:MAG: cation transporter [Candidatus Helarchaeota archaeon]